MKKEKQKPKVMWSYRIEPELMALLQLKRKQKGKEFPGWLRLKLMEAMK
jgi:hypothetical protein